jgi:hypothetical protein
LFENENIKSDILRSDSWMKFPYGKIGFQPEVTATKDEQSSLTSIAKELDNLRSAKNYKYCD